MVDPDVTRSATPGFPDHIGPYAIIDLLGRGGMGEVWLGQQIEPVTRRAAVKVVMHGAGPDVLLRFEEERRVLASLEHPGIAKLFEVGETDDGRPWFAMEVVHGRPIDEYCEDASLQKRLTIFRRVCYAMQHAHVRGVVHRDLKPTNILVEDIDGEALPKIIDFGIAKALDRRQGVNPLQTVVGGFLGTPAYASPEQACGDSRAIDARADVYSLGAILYQLVAGVPPFDPAELAKMTTFELQRTIAEVKPKPPSAVARNGFELGALDNVILRALEKDREERFVDAGALAAAIDAQLETRFVETPRVVRRSWRGRHGRLVAILLAALLLPLAYAFLKQTLFASMDQKVALQGVDGDRSMPGEVVTTGLSTLSTQPASIEVVDAGLVLTWSGRDDAVPTKLYIGRSPSDAAASNSELSRRLIDASTTTRVDVDASKRTTLGDRRRLTVPLGRDVEVEDRVVIEFACEGATKKLSAVLAPLAAQGPWLPTWAPTTADPLRLTELVQLACRPQVLHCDDLGFDDLVLLEGAATDEGKLLVYRASAPGVFAFHRRSVASRFEDRPFAASVHYHDTDHAPDLFMASDRGLWAFLGIHHTSLGVEQGRVFSYAYRPVDQAPSEPPSAFATGDFNGDGIVDIATIVESPVVNGVEGGTRKDLVLRIGGREALTIDFKWKWEDRKSAMPLPRGADHGATLCFRDLDADGRDEILVSIQRAQGDHSILAIPGNETCYVHGYRETRVGGHAVDFSRPCFAFLDVNGDGIDDLLDIEADGSDGRGRLRIHSGLTGHGFEAARLPSDLGLAVVRHLEAADVDDDGIEDLVVVESANDAGGKTESEARSGEPEDEVVVLIGRRDPARRTWHVGHRIEVGRFRDFVDLRMARFDVDRIVDFVVTTGAPDKGRGYEIHALQATPPRGVGSELVLDFAGEQRSRAFVDAERVATSMPRPGRTAIEVASGDDHLVVLEGADRDSIAELMVLDLAEPLLSVGLSAGLSEGRPHVLGAFKDVSGLDLAFLDARGDMHLAFLPRGWRAMPRQKTTLRAAEPFDDVWTLRGAPTLSGHPLRASLLARSKNRFSTFSHSAGSWQPGPSFTVSDIPDAVFVADLDFNGLDDVIAVRHLRTTASELEIHLQTFDAARNEHRFWRMPADAAAPNGPLFIVPGLVSSIVATPVGGRAAYQDDFKRGLVVGLESGEIAALYSKSLRAMPGYSIQQASDEDFVAVMPGKALLLATQDFDGDGLEDLVVAARDASALELRLQDKNASFVDGTPVGTGNFTRRLVLRNPWAGSDGWRIATLRPCRVDNDPIADLVVVAVHAGGERSVATWLTKLR